MPSSPSRRRLPPWLRISIRGGNEREEVRGLLRGLNLHTVCESAQCPNLCECWRQRTATVMILGNACTRDCRFCAVDHGGWGPPDPEEPGHVAEAAERLQLRFVVITSVTRDDLPDGGAAHFAATIRAVRARSPEVGIEVLIPDFQGRGEDLQTVLDAAPTVLNHNIETCRRLTDEIRSGADYDRSLALLRTAAELSADRTRVKSGIMIGLGEREDEIVATLRDLRQAGVRMLTIGQYLAPSRNHWPVARFYTPAEFDELGRLAREELGFEAVASAPLVRSSYLAEQLARGGNGGGGGESEE